jgi:biopolymer transport protein ExbB
MHYDLSFVLAETTGGVGLFELFQKSFDIFTILLLLASMVSVTVIVKCFMEITPEAILPIESERRIRQNLAADRRDDLEVFVSRDDAFVSRVVHAALTAPGGTKASAREQAELVASEQCGNWFRKLEPLSIIGNLGPLLGLAGTVWGMIYAFTSLGSAGGQASAEALSSGIAKALFHTLLGLMLAVPSLLVYGFYKARVDRLCTRALVISSELVDALPLSDEPAASRQAAADAARKPQPAGATR